MAETPLLFAAGFQVAERPPFVVTKVTSVSDGNGNIINGTLEPGDIISEVNNVLPSRAADITFGPKDSTVKLSVVSCSGRDFECTVMRNVPIRVWERWHRQETIVSRCMSASVHDSLEYGSINHSPDLLRSTDHVSHALQSASDEKANKITRGHEMDSREVNNVDNKTVVQHVNEEHALMEPIITALNLLRCGNGDPIDLMKNDSEYLSSTLGLTLEDDRVQYIIPAGPAFYTNPAYSIEFGDRIVAVDGEPVDADIIVDAIKKRDRVGSVCTLTIERARPATQPATWVQQSPAPLNNVRRMEVHLLRSSRTFVKRAEHMVELIEEHRRFLRLLCDHVTNDLTNDVMTSLDIILAHVFECEERRIQWEHRLSCDLAKLQGKCIKALEIPLSSQKTAQALVGQSTYQRHRANHLERRLQETLADLAHLTAKTDETVIDPLTAITIANMRSQLKEAKETAARSEHDIEELRSLMHKSSEELRSTQLELAFIKGSPQKNSSDDSVRYAEMEQRLKDIIASKDAQISASEIKIAELIEQKDGKLEHHVLQSRVDTPAATRGAAPEQASSVDTPLENVIATNPAAASPQFEVVTGNHVDVTPKLSTQSKLSAEQGSLLQVEDMIMARERIKELENQVREMQMQMKAKDGEMQSLEIVQSDEMLLMHGDQAKAGLSNRDSSFEQDSEPAIALTQNNLHAAKPVQQTDSPVSPRPVSPRVLKARSATMPPPGKGIDLLNKLREIVRRDVLHVKHETITYLSSEEAQKTSIGLMYDDSSGKIIVQSTLAGGPAFACNKIEAGDEIASVDGKHVVGPELIERLTGSNIPGSTVTLMVKKTNGRGILEVRLRRMPYGLLVDKKKIHDMFVKTVQIAKHDKDDEEVKTLDDGLHLWEKIVVADQHYEDQLVHNACMMQKDCEEQIGILNDALSKQEQGILFMEEEHRRLEKQVIELEEAKRKCLRELNDMKIKREQEKIKHDQIVSKLSKEISEAQERHEQHHVELEKYKKRALLLGKPVLITMTFDLDVSRIGEAGTPQRTMFEENLLKDLAQASGLSPDKFVLKKLMVTKQTIVTVEVIACEDGTYNPSEVAASFEKQTHDLKSSLKSGTVTLYATGTSMPTLEAHSHRVIQENQALLESVDRKQLNVDLLKAQNHARDLMKQLEKEKTLRKQLEAAAHPPTVGKVLSADTEGVEFVEKMQGETASLVDKNTRMEKQISELKKAIEHFQIRVPEHAALQAEIIRLQLLVAQSHGSGGEKSVDEIQLQIENTKMSHDVDRLQAQISTSQQILDVRTIPELGPSHEKLMSAVGKLWAKKSIMWGVCKLLLSLFASEDTASARQLRAMKFEQGSAEESVSDFLMAVEGLHADVLHDASLVLDVVMIDSGPIDGELMYNLCSSLVKVPPRIEQIRDLVIEAQVTPSAGQNVSRDAVPMPPVSNRDSFGDNVDARLHLLEAHSRPQNSQRPITSDNSTAVRNNKPEARITPSRGSDDVDRTPQLPLPTYTEVMTHQKQNNRMSPSPPPRGLASTRDSNLSATSSNAGSQAGDLAGVGMLLLFDGKGHSFVKELIRDGPADVDGTIHIGDQLVAIDGVEVLGKESKEIVNLIRGPHGSWIDLALYRQPPRTPSASTAASHLSSKHMANIIVHLMRLKTGCKAPPNAMPQLLGH